MAYSQEESKTHDPKPIAIRIQAHPEYAYALSRSLGLYQTEYPIMDAICQEKDIVGKEELHRGKVRQIPDESKKLSNVVAVQTMIMIGSYACTKEFVSMWAYVSYVMLSKHRCRGFSHMRPSPLSRFSGLSLTSIRHCAPVNRIAHPKSDSACHGRVRRDIIFFNRMPTEGVEVLE